MRKKLKYGVVTLLLLSFAAALFSGCTVSPYAKSGDKNVNPFYADKVATVRILMPEEDWETLKVRAYNKEYFKADFWFDDELVPDVGLRTKGNASPLQMQINDRQPSAACSERMYLSLSDSIAISARAG